MPRPGTNVSFLAPQPGTTHAPLHRVLQAVAERGHLDDVVTRLQRVLPSLRTLSIGVDSNDRPTAQIVVPGGTVPVAFAGDGAYALIRLTLGLAAEEHGTVLVEDPEAFMQPAAIVGAAQAIVGAVLAGTQVVVSTHSLELIDDLVIALEAHLPKMKLVRLLLRDGVLRTSEHPGPDVELMRGTINEDLR